MKYLTTLILLFYSITSLAANVEQDTTVIIEESSKHTSLVNDKSNVFKHMGEVYIKSDKQDLWEYILPFAIAIIVSLIAHLSGRYIAKLDFNKTVLSNNRQQWINNLRDVVSELISIASANKTKLSEEEYKRASFLIFKIELMLNPDKDTEFINSTLNLEEKLRQLHLGQRIPQSEEYTREVIGELKKHAKSTLKTEWERVKKGK